MPDQLTEQLSHLANDVTFRAAAERFLSLPQSSVDYLASLVEQHASFDVPTSDLVEFERACNLEEQGRHVLAAARVIRSAVLRINRDDRDRNLIDFASLISVSSFVPERFSRFFGSLPHLDQEDLKNTAIAVAPTLIGTRMYSDIRVVPHSPGGHWSLVPVVVARLLFDEDIAGQQAIFIQMTEESIKELKQELQNAESVLLSINDRIGDRFNSEEEDNKK